jgi:hypothetical protein
MPIENTVRRLAKSMRSMVRSFPGHFLNSFDCGDEERVPRKKPGAEAPGFALQ